LDAPRGSDRRAFAQRLFAGIAGGYDMMGRALSLGQDPRWRRFLVSRATPEAGSRVLDVAAGTGLVSRALLHSGHRRIVALDQSEAMMRAGFGRRDCEEPPGSISLVVGEADRLPFPDRSFDVVTFTYLLRYVDEPGSTLLELSRVLRNGGLLAGLEFFRPDDPFARFAWRAYTYGVMPLLATMGSAEWGRTGRFLGPSIERFYREYPLAEQVRQWQAAGIRRVRSRPLTFGAAIVTWGTKDAVDGG
jgi:demethylmenaquinone methyltransferase / 2-methoxy-6-polyprenyl-1,4-benzoquinol methylase